MLLSLTASVDHLTALTDTQGRANDGTSDSKLDSSTELFAVVNSVARMAARLLPCICARSQRGIKWVSGISHDVHGGEREERCVAVQGDL